MPHDRILDALLSFLPPRYRGGIAINAIRGGVISGIFETLLSLAILAHYYVEYMRPFGLIPHMPWDPQPATDWNKVASGLGAEAVTVLGFWFTPGAILPLYFALEGIVRMLSAGVSRDPCATLPLWIVAAIHDKFDSAAAARRLAPPAPDQVEPGKPGGPWDLRITAVRPKRDWHTSVTISYAGSIYEVVSRVEDRADDKPPYIYCLKKKDGIGAFRGIVHYDPFEFFRNQRRRTKVSLALGETPLAFPALPLGY